MDNTSKVISKEDLEILQVLKEKSRELTQRLGELEYNRRMIESEMDSIIPNFSRVENEYGMQFSRLQAKYGFANDALIDEVSGEIH